MGESFLFFVAFSVILDFNKPRAHSTDKRIVSDWRTCYANEGLLISPMIDVRNAGQATANVSGFVLPSGSGARRRVPPARDYESGISEYTVRLCADRHKLGFIFQSNQITVQNL